MPVFCPTIRRVGCWRVHLLFLFPGQRTAALWMLLVSGGWNCCTFSCKVSVLGEEFCSISFVERLLKYRLSPDASQKRRACPLSRCNEKKPLGRTLRMIWIIGGTLTSWVKPAWGQGMCQRGAGGQGGEQEGQHQALEPPSGLSRENLEDFSLIRRTWQ